MNYRFWKSATQKKHEEILHQSCPFSLPGHIFLVDKSKLKGYFRYKTITSQNVSSEAQIKNFFIL